MPIVALLEFNVRDAASTPFLQCTHAIYDLGELHSPTQRIANCLLVSRTLGLSPQFCRANGAWGEEAGIA